METRTLNTYELRAGMVVRNHGMRILLDGRRYEEKPNRYNNDWTHLAVGFADCTVLNHETMDNHIVPKSWRVDGKWTIQGNDYATWTVEV